MQLCVNNFECWFLKQSAFVLAQSLHSLPKQGKTEIEDGATQWHTQKAKAIPDKWWQVQKLEVELLENAADSRSSRALLMMLVSISDFDRLLGAK